MHRHWKNMDLPSRRRLDEVVEAQALHKAASSHRDWAFHVFALAFQANRTWDSIEFAETELLRASEVVRLAERALRVAEFNYLTYRPLGGPNDRKFLRPSLPKPA